MKKVFTVGLLRKLELQVRREEISYSRMVEMLNEIAYYEYTGNEPDYKKMTGDVHGHEGNES